MANTTPKTTASTTPRTAAARRSLPQSSPAAPDSINSSPASRRRSAAYSSSPLARTPSTTSIATSTSSRPQSLCATPSPLTRSSLGHHRQLLAKPRIPSASSLPPINQPSPGPSAPSTADQASTDNEDDDLVTQVPEQAELDAEMHAAIQTVIQTHARQLSGLRRVLSSADHGSAMTIHLLHAEIKLLQDRLEADQAEIRRLTALAAKQTLREQHAQAAQAPPRPQGSIVDVLSASNDLDLRRYFRTLPPPSRLHLLHLLLEAAVPGDISSLRRYLEQIERSRRDFIGHLPDDLAVKCLLYLDLGSILNARCVSHRWNEVVMGSGREIWRSLSLALTSRDDEPPRPQEDSSSGWFGLYKGLHYREENWRKGRAQRVVVLKGHSGSIGAIKLRGVTLVTGSLDGSLRIWNVRSSNCLKIVKMPAPVSSLDFFGQYGPTGVIAAGGNDVGRVFLISMTGTILSTLSGHNKGIRTLAMNSQYLVSGGYDKALVVWNWREGTRIVKFGQQTNPCAAISLFGATFSSVQVDGVIRCFSIAKRELVSQHKVQTSYERGADKPSPGGEVFQWFVAEARRVIIATKTTIFQLEYNLDATGCGADGLPSVDLAAPPRLISRTPITHELNSGTLDVLKRRFAAAPRFATRLGDDMRIFIGHLPEHPSDQQGANDEEDEETDADGLQPIGGAWLDADARVSSRNPTCMSLSSDQLVVGCSDGLLYALDFCGDRYRDSSPGPSSD
ncbi:hypothetical protein PtA15_7A405 [Puccinia triticina]|uniref:F-box domain-containing protein n=1 Tax=Puccinia triticina TaxID=208348 RepID=A0ABY7CQD8_9BASI|nr:uncharacterized protein PtA15_7A405 [Puccinia triticina]WAQ86677.1 hypothetical protein PtA15_7A405 [Puccinia triticina]